MEICITSLLPEHWPAVKAIYEEGIATGNATFQTEAPSWAHWDKSHLSHSRLIALTHPQTTSPETFAGPGPSSSSPETFAGPGPSSSSPETFAGPGPSSPIAGWAALSPVSSRCVYSGVAEVSVYIASSWRGKKIGLSLLEALIRVSERNGIWTLQAGIFPENIPSLAIHAHCGFREIGRRERIGAMNGRWRDTILLERRSSTVGL
jgi:L-amino acid N-acyltransferase YncA